MNYRYSIRIDERVSLFESYDLYKKTPVLVGPIGKIRARFGSGISREILLRPRILLVIEKYGSFLEFLDPCKSTDDPLSVSRGKGKDRKRRFFKHDFVRRNLD